MAGSKENVDAHCVQGAAATLPSTDCMAPYRYVVGLTDSAVHVLFLASHREAARVRPRLGRRREYEALCVQHDTRISHLEHRVEAKRQVSESAPSCFWGPQV